MRRGLEPAGLLARLGLALLLGAGCHGEPATGAAGFAVPLSAAAAPGDEIVATVDGRPLFASAVAAQARAAGVSPRAALEQLLDAEVLAGEARRRGLDSDREALAQARADAVLRLLEQTFEAEVRPESMPERVLKRAYNANINMYDHSTYADVWHILVPAVESDPPAYHEKARALAEEIARRARQVKDAVAFQAIAKEVTRPEGVRELRVEQVVSAKDGWLDPQFTVPVFEQLERPGDTSKVIHTDKFGYHVAFLVKYIPPVHLTLAEAAPEIRRGLFPSYQRSAFAPWVGEVSQHHQVQVFPERLGAPEAPEAKR